MARLLTEAEEMGSGREKRRETLIERAESRGLERADAERAYDLAREEGLDPVYGLALVGQGISVRSFGGEANVEVAEAVEPEWIDNPPDPDEASLERRLRETFRRFRSFLEREPSVRDAIREFGKEPDLEAYDY
ncbi:MAG TPA: hypothetical protein VK966_11185 [Longimicrobiales bacterium]|nr:hypothetical protein [Longimicrobiales bacterium]